MRKTQSKCSLIIRNWSQIKWAAKVKLKLNSKNSANFTGVPKRHTCIIPSPTPLDSVIGQTGGGSYKTM